jgi:electron transfer flavoprotein beta subunit
MNIVVCVKQVPSTTEVRLDPETHTIVRDGSLSVLNPFDAFAVELGVRLKEACGGKVTALSMGISATENLLRDAIARGADGAVLLCDRRFAGADTLATSYTLSLGVAQIGLPDLILCGRMAVDGDTGQIGPELAEQLNLPHATDVTAVDEVTCTHIFVTQAMDGSLRKLKVPFPCVLTIVRGVSLFGDAAMVRMPSIAGIRRSFDADVRVLDADAVKADPARIGLLGSATRVVGTHVPERTKVTAFIHGKPGELTRALLGIIEANGGSGHDTH